MAKISDKLSGKGHEHIPGLAFRIMSGIMWCMDVFGYARRNCARLQLKPGDTVVDYGCGPARYILPAAKAIGTQGHLYALDIHPMALRKARNVARKHGLRQVHVMKVSDYETLVPDAVADVVYALDMFHMVEQPEPFLRSCLQMMKPEARLIIEDGHQSRDETRQKINCIPELSIVAETKTFVCCNKSVK